MKPSDQTAAQAPAIAPVTRVAIRQTLSAWYGGHRRDLPWRRTGDPYTIWVSEVMLQQTQVKTVTPYFQRFMQRFPDVGRLAQADEQSVLKLWEGLGYYSRARHLHQAAQRVVREWGGRLPSTWPEIRQLPGIGDYIAAAVLSIAFAQPHAVVDGNVKRVLSRLLRVATPVNAATGHQVFQAAADQLLDVQNPGRHNQAMMELGALVCSPQTPLCAQCPLARFCVCLKSRTTDQYPRRSERRPVGSQHWVAGAVIKNGRLLLTQRPAQGLLAGLWEFPGGAIGDKEDAQQACVEKLRETVGIKVEAPTHVAMVRHAYTHFKLRLELYLCPYRSGRIRRNGPAACRWVRPDQLARFPLHRAVHKALPELIQGLSKSL